MECIAIIDPGYILIEVFAQKLTTEGANGIGLGEGDIHLAVSEELESAVQVARAGR